MKFRIGGFLALMLFLPFNVRGEEAKFNHSSWHHFLREYVQEGAVDYRRLVRDPRILDRYLDEVAQIPAPHFEDFSREEKVALYINLHNALTVKTVLSLYPLKHLRDIPGEQEQEGRLLGQKLNRRAVEAILRNQFRDERVLVALYRATRGGPRLRSEAYTGENGDRLLEEDARNFVNDESQNRLESGQRKIWISSLFRWYGDDFILNYGTSRPFKKFSLRESAVLSFIAYYIHQDKKAYLENGRFKIRYLPFDWNLAEPAIHYA